MPHPTEYDELNALLGDLVAEGRRILGAAFVGAYLQGSFALGAADLASDCDFLVVTGRPVTDEEYAGLATLHADLPTRPGHWSRHLEGSYAVRAELRGLAGLGRPWPYIDHGSRELRRDTHCRVVDPVPARPSAPGCGPSCPASSGDSSPGSPGTSPGASATS
jgi:hypothetical protein